MEKRNIYIGSAVAAVLVIGGMIWAASSKNDAKAPVVNAPQENTEENDLLYVFAGPTWVWDRTEQSDGTVVRPNKPGAFTITFDSSKGTVSGTSDCNGFGADYTSGAVNSLSFGPFVSTLMFCEGSEESVFRKMVENATRYIFTESGDLVLLLKADSGSVIFKRKVEESKV